MSGVKVGELPVSRLYLGEGPHWQEDIEALLYVDVFNKAVCRYFVNTGRCQVLHIDDGGKAKTVTIVVPVEGCKDWYVVSVGNTLCGVQWKVTDPDNHTTKPKVLQVTLDSHFNDGKCDPQGRLWAGTMGPQDDKGELLKMNVSSLYRLDSNLTMNKCVDKVSVSNGLTWSPDKKHFYYIDSEAFSIDAFCYDDLTGQIGNRRVLLDYKKSQLGEDIPDGMTCDVSGNLWVANFKGSKVICVNPETGQVIRQVNLPSKNVTSVCWGGPDYSTLFVTSGKMRLTQDELEKIPAAGATFAVTGLGAKGFPANGFRPDLDLFRDKMGL
ncbi:regucalcin-like [Palaemon carinicauda]|uniref:regucalcin-like n=1 Tax=Palaemon carinicauda TaxID=392227 RepID=UPI0035B625CB